MAAIASDWIALENGQCQLTHRPRKNLYMPGFKEFNWKYEQFIKIDKTRIATVASFSVSRENGQC